MLHFVKKTGDSFSTWVQELIFTDRLFLSPEQWFLFALCCNLRKNLRSPFNCTFLPEDMIKKFMPFLWLKNLLIQCVYLNFEQNGCRAFYDSVAFLLHFLAKCT